MAALPRKSGGASSAQTSWAKFGENFSDAYEGEVSETVKEHRGEPGEPGSAHVLSRSTEGGGQHKAEKAKGGSSSYQRAPSLSARL